MKRQSKNIYPNGIPLGKGLEEGFSYVMDKMFAIQYSAPTIESNSTVNLICSGFITAAPGYRFFGNLEQDQVGDILYPSQDLIESINKSVKHYVKDVINQNPENNNVYNIIFFLIEDIINNVPTQDVYRALKEKYPAKFSTLQITYEKKYKEKLSEGLKKLHQRQSMYKYSVFMGKRVYSNIISGLKKTAVFNKGEKVSLDERKVDKNSQEEYKEALKNVRKKVNYKRNPVFIIKEIDGENAHLYGLDKNKTPQEVVVPVKFLGNPKPLKDESNKPLTDKGYQRLEEKRKKEFEDKMRSKPSYTEEQKRKQEERDKAQDQKEKEFDYLELAMKKMNLTYDHFEDINLALKARDRINKLKAHYEKTGKTLPKGPVSNMIDTINSFDKILHERIKEIDRNDPANFKVVEREINKLKKQIPDLQPSEEFNKEYKAYAGRVGDEKVKELMGKRNVSENIFDNPEEAFKKRNSIFKIYESVKSQNPDFISEQFENNVNVLREQVDDFTGKKQDKNQISTREVTRPQYMEVLQILDIPHNATDDQIEKKIVEKKRQFANDPEKMKKLNQAFEIIKNYKKQEGQGTE